MSTPTASSTSSPAPSVPRVIGRALLWGLAWALLAPIVTLLPMIAIYMTDSRCGSAGDSGGCEMGIASVVMAMIPVGLVLGFCVTLARGLWRVHRARV